MTEQPQTTAEREVFRAEKTEGQYIRLIACGEPDESLFDGLESFIAWRRRICQEQPDA